MIEVNLDSIATRRKDILTDLGTNGLAKAALALGMVDRDVVALVAEVVRLNNELIDAELRIDSALDIEHGPFGPWDDDLRLRTGRADSWPDIPGRAFRGRPVTEVEERARELFEGRMGFEYDDDAYAGSREWADACLDAAAEIYPGSVQRAGGLAHLKRNI